MRVRQLEIENFPGITEGRVVFQQHTLLVGGNNIGKSTVCEALELVLGPERFYRRPAIDEHDFSHSDYLGDDGDPRKIRVQLFLVRACTKLGGCPPGRPKHLHLTSPPTG